MGGKTATADNQLVLGAGQRDIEDAPFFFNVVNITERAFHCDGIFRQRCAVRGFAKIQGSERGDQRQHHRVSQQTKDHLGKLGAV